MIFNIIGGAILAFGLYQIHSISNVTEGGVLGLTLLFQHWLGLSPSISGLVLNAACYLFGYKTLGKQFIRNSFIAGGSFPSSTHCWNRRRAYGRKSANTLYWRPLAERFSSVSASDYASEISAHQQATMHWPCASPMSCTSKYNGFIWPVI